MPISSECRPKVKITKVKYEGRNFSHDLVRIEWTATPPESCLPLTEFRLQVCTTRKHGRTEDGPLTVPGTARTAVVEVRRHMIGGDVASFRAQVVAVAALTSTWTEVSEGSFNVVSAADASHTNYGFQEKARR